MCGRCGCVDGRAPDEVIRPAVLEGLIEPGLLLLLLEGEGYGYDLAPRLSARALVPAPVTPARVYETLRRLESDGAVAGRFEANADGPERHLFRITSDGRERLRRWSESLRPTARSLDLLLDQYDALRV